MPYNLRRRSVKDLLREDEEQEVVDEASSGEEDHVLKNENSDESYEQSDSCKDFEESEKE